jgi:hypothetical protein
VRYQNQRVVVHHTQARQISIGERRKPDPRGRPGYLGVDTAHQGNLDGHPGLYHINAVDTVTQWQAVGCVETISERHLIPVLEAMLHPFPFRILGFHGDHGSEFLNYTVAQLLVEFTKSRPYRTTDNALVEGQKGAVTRQPIGYGVIAAQHAGEFPKFYTAGCNSYLNYHRPCGFATLEIGALGKRRRFYPAEDYRTPYEKLVSLPDWNQYLKPGITAEFLLRQATRMSDRSSSTNAKSQTHLAGQVSAKSVNAFAGSLQRWAGKGAHSPPLSPQKQLLRKEIHPRLHLPPS